jgi:hypothetical protein
MKTDLQSFMKELEYKRQFLAVILVNIVGLVVLQFLGPNLPPEAPLLYANAAGEEQLIETRYLGLPFVICLLVCLINLVLVPSLEDKFLKQVLLGVSFVVSILALITVTKIVFLVGNI